MQLPRWSWAPPGILQDQRKNFINVQIDAIGVGLASAASPFLPVFLARLGATNTQVGLLTSMPGITGLVLAILVGIFLQNRRNIVPWFSASRLLVLSSYASTGLAAFFVPEEHLVVTVLAIWAIATLPQTALSVCFSVVMNAVAGSSHRYELMSRRWTILGLTTAIMVTIAGQILDNIDFPINYQIVFLALSVGGLISYYFSSQISLPDTPTPMLGPVKTPTGKRFSFSASAERLRALVGKYLALIWSEKPFLRISVKRFVFFTGAVLATPLFPLYYVREVNANDAWIGFISTTQTFVTMIGYMVWARQSRKRSSRFVLLIATFGMSLYPVLVASTQRVELMVVFAGLAGIFQSGIDLVFFDELMRTVPEQYSATFVSLAQSTQYASTIAAPLIGTWLAGQIGLGWALVASAVVRLVGACLFAFWNPK